MSDGELRERLRRRTGRAMAESVTKQAVLDRDAPRSPRPGDVFALGEDPESPVEWVVLEPGPSESGRLVAAPADTNPMAGTRDLALDDPAAGPLVLRLGHTASFEAGLFDPAARRGALTADVLERVRRAHRRLERGELWGSVRQREMDADPAYEDWIRDHVEPAREALASTVGEVEAEDQVLAFPDRTSPEPGDRTPGLVPARWVQLLAAALVLVTLGLSSWIVIQQRQITRLSRPSFNLPFAQIRLNEVERSTEPIAVPGDAAHLLLYLVLYETEPCESYELEIFGRGDQRVWARTLDVWPIDDVHLVLPRSVLDREPLTLRLHGDCGGERKLLDERALRIAT